MFKQAALATAVALSLIVPASAQQPPPAYGPPITFEAAKKAMAAAEAEATKNNWAVAIAILDSSGHLVMLHKMDNVQYASIKIAEGKAQTAVDFRRPSKALEDTIAGGGAGLRVLTFGNILVRRAHCQRRQDHRFDRRIRRHLAARRADRDGWGRCSKLGCNRPLDERVRAAAGRGPNFLVPRIFHGRGPSPRNPLLLDSAAPRHAVATHRPRPGCSRRANRSSGLLP